MSEFHTPAAQQAYYLAELEMEQWQLALDKYDPYNDFDDDQDPDDEGDEWVNEDAGMEGYLFGWDS